MIKEPCHSKGGSAWGGRWGWAGWAGDGQGEKSGGLRKRGNAPQIWIRATGKGNVCTVVAFTT